MGVFAFLQQNSQKRGRMRECPRENEGQYALVLGSAPTPIFNREQPITRGFPDLQPIFK